MLEPAPTRPDPEDLAAERARVQVGVIRRALRDKVAIAPVEGTRSPDDDADAHYLYRPRHALVRRDRMPDLRVFFEQRQDIYLGGVEPAEERRKLPPGVELVVLPARRDEGDEVLATIEEIDGELGEGALTPDHVLYVTVRGAFCPATEPEMTRSTPVPAITADADAGRGIRISVVDTGLWTDAVTSQTTPWMEGVAPASAADVETVNPAAIHEYAGHGTFVAGVVQCLAPASVVEVEGALPHGGAVYESEICEQLHQALTDRDDPQIISISAGTHTRKNIDLLGFEMLAEAHGLADGEKTIVVAAAGNDSSRDKFWPAAFPWVVGVGSVDADGAFSDYSNYGNDWVDVYARGRDLVNAFPVGTYTCHEPPNVGQVRHFKGLAQWSGTSFSTPIVAGLIAARMSSANEDAAQAWAAVLATATPGTTKDPAGNEIKVVGPLT